MVSKKVTVYLGSKIYIFFTVYMGFKRATNKVYEDTFVSLMGRSKAHRKLPGRDSC
jgi:hypothetical protein